MLGLLGFMILAVSFCGSVTGFPEVPNPLVSANVQDRLNRLKERVEGLITLAAGKEINVILLVTVWAFRFWC
jgi:hypothetical protein